MKMKVVKGGLLCIVADEDFIGFPFTLIAFSKGETTHGERDTEYMSTQEERSSMLWKRIVKL